MERNTEELRCLRHFIWDFDGTLFYGTTDINYYAINMALEDMGRPAISREEANSTVGDRIPDACRRLLGTDDPELCQQLYDGIFRHAQANLGSFFRTFTGVA